MRTAWEILGIEPTDNKRQIKRAYAKLLQQYHPEEYPKEFQEIQQAYQQVLQQVEQGISSQSTYVETEDEILEDTQKQYTTSTLDELHIQDTNKKIDVRNNEEITQNKHTTANIDELHIQVENQSQNTYDKKQFYYEKIEDRLQFRQDLETIDSIVKNTWFFDLLSDEKYYQKICELFISYIPKYSDEVLSTLIQIFDQIEQKYSYSKQVSVKQQMLNYQKKQRKKQGNRRNLAFVIVFVVLINLARLMFTSNEPTQSTEEYYEQQIEEQVKNTYEQASCHILEMNDDEIIFTCTVNKEEAISGHATYDEEQVKKVILDVKEENKK